jgi:hypothetical protein
MKERTGKLEAQTTDRVAYPKLRTSHVPWRRRDQHTNDDGVWNGDQLGELHVGVRQVFEDAGFAEVRQPTRPGGSLCGSSVPDAIRSAWSGHLHR